jgi:hypothetical protein
MTRTGALIAEREEQPIARNLSPFLCAGSAPSRHEPLSGLRRVTPRRATTAPGMP